MRWADQPSPSNTRRRCGETGGERAGITGSPWTLAQVGRCCRGHGGSVNRVGVTNSGPSSRIDSYHPNEICQVRPRDQGPRFVGLSGRCPPIGHAAARDFGGCAAGALLRAGWVTSRGPVIGRSLCGDPARSRRCNNRCSPARNTAAPQRRRNSVVTASADAAALLICRRTAFCFATFLAVTPSVDRRTTSRRHHDHDQPN